ncbi:hypothetical protein Nepgr_022024 [Nepenthes gracilis]|uniref:Uncharacterized protein n=1 Tax=Nepenthes gracilis TaxID=150966 RepID=A0AAD3SZI9_NEPGR|nr:hypothetical protein Nepgr_022024 [Nepenthes gracilis]
MARKKTSSPASPIPVGNCEVVVEGNAKCFTSQSNKNSLLLVPSGGTKTQISVALSEEVNKKTRHGLGDLRSRIYGEDNGNSSHPDCKFLLINPKDTDSSSKSLLKEVQFLYMKELPAMNFAANTGKESTFIERCVSNGKYCTLLLRYRSVENAGEIIAAITYQIIPADTQYAEIPLAAVSSMYQHKGIGRMLYTEMRKRLRDVGICKILCWGDNESAGFWHKQGFISIAEIDTKGKAPRLPIKVDIRRALCFPGGSTLMISHLNNHLQDTQENVIKMSLSYKKPFLPAADKVQPLECIEKSANPLMSENQISAGAEHLQQEAYGFPLNDSPTNCQELVPYEKLNINTTDLCSVKHGCENLSSTHDRDTKRRVWETSLSSLKSKRVKASHLADYKSYSASGFVLESERKGDSCCDGCSLAPIRDKSLPEAKAVESPAAGCMLTTIEGCIPVDPPISTESRSTGRTFNIMLMDIADGAKKMHLTKIIEELGGAVTADGSLTTHVLTGKIRRTKNFCIALCSGAWILSPNWLKASFREGRFVDEMPYILEDEEYLKKFRLDLKEPVLRARSRPQALLKGYNICLSAHILPPMKMLSAIIRSAGGNVLRAFDKIRDKSSTIFVACEEDMEEALLAVKGGIRTFSSDWFMNCIMKQELDLEALQFAESLS